MADCSTALRFQVFFVYCGPEGVHCTLLRAQPTALSVSVARTKICRCVGSLTTMSKHGNYLTFCCGLRPSHEMRSQLETYGLWSKVASAHYHNEVLHLLVLHLGEAVCSRSPQLTPRLYRVDHPDWKCAVAWD